MSINSSLAYLFLCIWTCIFSYTWVAHSPTPSCAYLIKHQILYSLSLPLIRKLYLRSSCDWVTHLLTCCTWVAHSPTPSCAYLSIKYFTACLFCRFQTCTSNAPAAGLHTCWLPHVQTSTVLRLWHLSWFQNCISANLASGLHSRWFFVAHMFITHNHFRILL